MDIALDAAFRATLYRFDLPEGELLLKVDTPNTALSRFLLGKGAGSMAVLTAFNPHARHQQRSCNLDSQERLRQALAIRGFTPFRGRNEDARGEWVEESFLVPGIGLTEARALAALFGQVAFLWCDAASATPLLIETGAPD